jgi:hypothetical protein
MSYTYGDYLLEAAQRHWVSGAPLPVDLFIALNSEGIDIDNEYDLFDAAQNQQPNGDI